MKPYTLSPGQRAVRTLIYRNQKYDREIDDWFLLQLGIDMETQRRTPPKNVWTCLRHVAFYSVLHLCFWAARQWALWLAVECIGSPVRTLSDMSCLWGEQPIEVRSPLHLPPIEMRLPLLLPPHAAGGSVVHSPLGYRDGALCALDSRHGGAAPRLKAGGIAAKSYTVVLRVSLRKLVLRHCHVLCVDRIWNLVVGDGCADGGGRGWCTERAIADISGLVGRYRALDRWSLVCSGTCLG